MDVRPGRRNERSHPSASQNAQSPAEWPGCNGSLSILDACLMRQHESAVALEPPGRPDQPAFFFGGSAAGLSRFPILISDCGSGGIDRTALQDARLNSA